MSKLSVVKSANLRITKPLYLREFSDALGDDYLSVWVNPDGDFVNARLEFADIAAHRKAVGAAFRDEIRKPGITEERLREITANLQSIKDEYDAALEAILSRLWAVPVDDIRAIKAASDQLFQWCIERSFAIMDGIEVEQKKAAGAR